MAFETSTDSFGNTFLKCLNNTFDIDSLYKQIETIKKPNKGIVFVGFSNTIISQLNCIHYNGDIIYLSTNNGENYHLMINNSSCPQFCDNTIRASGVSVVLKHESSYFSLLMKDRTKKILSCIGGVCTQSEYKSNPNYSLRVAKRELKEETQGIVEVINRKLQGETQGFVEIGTDKIYCSGIVLTESEQLDIISQVEFLSTYYGLKVPDFYTCYKHTINTPDLYDRFRVFVSLMFDERNRLPNGDYQLNYLDNSETEYIYAIKLSDNIIDTETHNFQTIMDNISSQTSKIDLNGSRISNLHMFFNYVHLKTITENSKSDSTDKYEFNDLEMFSKLKLHPSLRKLSYKW
ncbi:hypothetical protein QJ850_gp862 [Acanthamoeba polyphaga mimivirus]|uniref:Nudix hydrolase domain-containing protein n=1 Tax=Acanthamoeba polyphaga mimivirus Kroon TaxID=3069720 RepID=A0A0G2Y7P0_9VIRU|nr:hypothetical protein QJ850_gp862 [Acanthamoeba polyphaga mimivirus]AKI79837.1 hypothetical protein [Acanthamoeba polyphaga mimivirus Kroon]